MLVAVMLLHTFELEHANVPIWGWYFFVVVPTKLLNLMFVIVNGEGNNKQRVKLLWP
jgi:hypothetical protein